MIPFLSLIGSFSVSVDSSEKRYGCDSGQRSGLTTFAAGPFENIGYSRIPLHSGHRYPCSGNWDIDVVFLKIRSVVRELLPIRMDYRALFVLSAASLREVVYLVKVFCDYPVRILVSAGELVGPADNCADRFAGVG